MRSEMTYTDRIQTVGEVMTHLTLPAEVGDILLPHASSKFGVGENRYFFEGKQVQMLGATYE